jgi:serine/threonine-protein kinase HipA
MNAMLIVAAGGAKMGQIEKGARGRLRFIYDEDWRAARASFPLSLSMPLAGIEYGHDAIEPYLWGLLPDNELVLDAWAKKFQVSARDVFALISNVGEDCAGAAQFVRPERSADFFHQRKPRVDWLSEADVAARLRDLRHDPTAWRALRDTGYFSLAGAQAKTALFFDGERWGVPSGRTPTTHILKPPTRAFDGHAENELFCLRLARRLGLPAADAEVVTFKAETAIVVERYDRVRLDDTVVRVHQEDICQALGLSPTKKYENEGGPGVRATVDLIRDVSSLRAEDLATFLGAIIFNWLIAGTDAHAKNYSLLIGAGGRVRLAPLYDVASALPYAALNQHKLKSAMKIGGEYLLKNISVRHWRKLAAETRFDEGAVIDQARAMAHAMPGEADAERHALKAAGLSHPIVVRLADRLAVRARRLERLLG